MDGSTFFVMYKHLRAEDNNYSTMCTAQKIVCKKCGWDFEANKETCPNCSTLTVTIEGVCVKDGKVNQIIYHPVNNPIPLEGATLICKNCGGRELKNVTIKVERR